MFDSVGFHWRSSYAGCRRDCLDLRYPFEASVVCSQICASKSDVDDLLTKLKITPCPHCKRTGFLSRHGSLVGYGLNQMGNAVRGARAVRIYCSNRYRSNGCGRTFSVWTADKIKLLFLSADSLWQFLSQAVSSGNKLQAFRNLKCGLSDRRLRGHCADLLHLSPLRFCSDRISALWSAMHWPSAKACAIHKLVITLIQRSISKRPFWLL